MKSEVHIAICREARPEDMPVCAAILNRWIDETEWMPRVHDHSDVERHYKETVFAERKVFVAERGEKLTGFLVLSSDGYVTALYVDGRHRGSGVGKALLSAATLAHPDELRLWTFDANKGAQRFYEREGFIPINRSDGDNEEGLPDILYARTTTQERHP